MSDDADFISIIDPFARTALRQAGYRLHIDVIRTFLSNLAASVAVYRSGATDEPSARDAHDALRQVWRLPQARDPDPEEIRRRLAGLPGPARAWICQRAGLRWPLLTGQPYSQGALDRWLATAGQAELIRGLEALIAEGGALVEGRRDRPPRRSFEPMIMGVIRGSGAGLSRGGRPTVSARDALVMHMAVDWAQATGDVPRKQRHDRDGFAGLVHRVFDELEIEAPDQALRRYWTAFDERQGRLGTQSPAADGLDPTAPDQST